MVGGSLYLRYCLLWLFLEVIDGTPEGDAARKALRELLTEKFGSLPGWAMQRLQTASAEDLHAWAKRVLHSTTLEETLR